MKLDFNILETHNSKTLVFVDESIYGDTTPIFPTLQIRMPGLEKVYKQLIRTEKVNVLYSTSIGWADVVTDFPDGVYEFKYSIHPNNILFVCKKFIKLDTAYNDLKKINCNINCKDDKYFSKLAEIQLLLLSCQLEVECNSEEAIKKLDLAKKLIKKLSC
jgi:hypothetical protein